MNVKICKLVRASVFFAVFLPALLMAQYYPHYGTPKPGTYKGVAGSFHGKLKDLSSKEIAIQTDDDQTVTIHRTRKTKFFKGDRSIQASAIELGSVVTVEAKEEPADLSLTAVTVI